MFGKCGAGIPACSFGCWFPRKKMTLFVGFAGFLSSVEELIDFIFPEVEPVGTFVVVEDSGEVIGFFL